MKNLKLLICPLGNSVDSLNLTFAALSSRYGITDFDIAGVIGDGQFSFQGCELKNVSPANVHETSFDYVIAVWEGLFDPAIPDYSPLKKTLAEKINAPSESIIFDFEICSGTFVFSKICLVVVFNHRFDKNLPLLRKIYGARFSEIRFLVPFYDGADDDVIPVYESSHEFQGYFIQAYDKLKDVPCTHYLFIGDDLIINPAFDETNFVGRIKMYDKKFLITTFTQLNKPNMFRWTWVATSSQSFYNPFTSWKDSLYTYDEAISKFNDFFGEQYKEFYDEEFFGDPKKSGKNSLCKWKTSKGFSKAVKLFKESNGDSLKIPYPMARGYSDIFCVDKDSLFEFSRLCGIFSGMNLFCEIAIPTTVVLTFKRDDVKLLKNNPGYTYKKTLSIENALILWGNERIAFEQKYNRDFNKLVSEWDEELICVHPIKLSGWKNV